MAKFGYTSHPLCQPVAGGGQIISTLHVPCDAEPIGLVVAIHGGGFDERYFQVPGFSTVDVLAEAGLATLTINRPGYGNSHTLETQRPILSSAGLLDEYVSNFCGQAYPSLPIILLGHSIGGAVAIEIAARRPPWLCAVSVSGIGRTPPASVVSRWRSLSGLEHSAPDPERDRLLFFSQDHTFDPQGFAAAARVRTRSLRSELLEVVQDWPGRFKRIASEIEVPVQIALAADERLWISSPEEVHEIAGLFKNAKHVDARLLQDGGHLYEFHRTGPEWLRAQRDFLLDAVAQARHRG